MHRKPGRPKKPTNEKVVKRMVSFSPENHAYIAKIIEDRKLSFQGSYSKIVNELIGDHRKVRRFKEIEKQKLQEKLDSLR